MVQPVPAPRGGPTTPAMARGHAHGKGSQPNPSPARKINTDPVPSMAGKKAATGILTPGQKFVLHKEAPRHEQGGQLTRQNAQAKARQAQLRIGQRAQAQTQMPRANDAPSTMRRLLIPLRCMAIKAPALVTTTLPSSRHSRVLSRAKTCPVQ